MVQPEAALESGFDLVLNVVVEDLFTSSCHLILVVVTAVVHDPVVEFHAAVEERRGKELDHTKGVVGVSIIPQPLAQFVISLIGENNVGVQYNLVIWVGLT